MEKDFLTILDLNREDILRILDLADEIKKSPKKYSTSLSRKTLVMI